MCCLGDTIKKVTTLKLCTMNTVCIKPLQPFVNAMLLAQGNTGLTVSSGI